MTFQFDRALCHAFHHAVLHGVLHAASCAVGPSQGAGLQLSTLEDAHGWLTQTLGPSRIVGEMELLRTIGGLKSGLALSLEVLILCDLVVAFSRTC